MSAPCLGWESPCRGAQVFPLPWRSRPHGCHGTVCGSEAQAGSAFSLALCHKSSCQRSGVRKGRVAQGWSAGPVCVCLFALKLSQQAHSSEECCQFGMTFSRECHYRFCVLVWQLKTESVAELSAANTVCSSSLPKPISDMGLWKWSAERLKVLAEHLWIILKRVLWQCTWWQLIPTLSVARCKEM